MQTAVIRGLIHTLERSSAGLGGVATRLSVMGNEQLSERFVDLARQRRRFSEELVELARGQGMDIDGPGSAVLSSDERWVELSGSSNMVSSAALVEAAAGEKEVRARFRDALADPSLNGRVRKVVARQQIEIAATHREVRALRDNLQSSGDSQGVGPDRVL